MTPDNTESGVPKEGDCANRLAGNGCTFTHLLTQCIGALLDTLIVDWFLIS